MEKGIKDGGLIKLKDLEKWVNEYELIFKMRYASHVGCTFEVYKQGYSAPWFEVTAKNCVEAVCSVVNMLNYALENGGF